MFASALVAKVVQQMLVSHMDLEDLLSAWTHQKSHLSQLLSTQALNSEADHCSCMVYY